MSDENKIKATLTQNAIERGLIGNLRCVKDDDVNYTVYGEGDSRIHYTISFSDGWLSITSSVAHFVQ